jgi:hypothetical protein
MAGQVELVETTRAGYLSRIGQSIKGVLVGGLLFFVALLLLFWNEGRAVRTAKGLAEGAAVVKSVTSDAVDLGNEGALVHVSGLASPGMPLRDESFGASAHALRLERQVEMYQWQQETKSEKTQNLGGGEETKTTYSYTKAWSRKPIDSASFKLAAEHRNPPEIPFKELDLVASDARLGAFRLGEALVRKIGGSEPLALSDAMLQSVPEASRPKGRIQDGLLCIGADPANPQVGDVRVSFRIVKPQTVSVVAQQTNGSFATYKARSGSEVLLLEAGTHDARAMFRSAEAGSAALTWALRLGGWFLMTFGVTLVLRPIAAIAGFVPAVGRAVGCGTWIFSGFVSLGLSLTTIAFSWAFFRPFLAIAVAVLAGAGFAAAITMARKARASARAAAGS